MKTPSFREFSLGDNTFSLSLYCFGLRNPYVLIPFAGISPCRYSSYAGVPPVLFQTRYIIDSLLVILVHSMVSTTIFHSSLNLLPSRLVCVSNCSHSNVSRSFILLFKILCIYLGEREQDRERLRKRLGVGAEGKADFPLSRKPNLGLDPKTPGLRPKPKAEA